MPHSTRIKAPGVATPSFHHIKTRDRIERHIHLPATRNIDCDTHTFPATPLVQHGL